MASSLEDDLACPACLKVYQDPHVLSCGHSFCRGCVGFYHKGLFVFYTEGCPVCHQKIHQQPVTNLVLRSTCNSYQREKEKPKEEDDDDTGNKCLLHGEKILFFCKNDNQAICSRCRKQSHMLHKVQLLTHTVAQRKDQIKAALRPAEKVLESLRNGTALEHKVTKHIESQAKQTEMQIKKEFEKLYHFLRVEEEARRAALKEEEKKKKEKLEEWIEHQMQSLSDRVMEVEEELENDDVTFLSNYDHIMTRAQGNLSDSQLNSGSLIDVSKHVGNLTFRVWEKMKDLCPYYPVVLDPNSTHISVSDDLVGVSHPVHRFYFPNPLKNNVKHLVIGSEPQNAIFNCWEVEVGSSKHWTLGVCQHSAAERNFTPPLTPQNGFWGLCRNGDSCYVLGSTQPSIQVKRPLKTVQVKLIQRIDLNNFSWVLRFVDTSNASNIARIPIETFKSDLFPFLIPEDRNAVRIVPVNVNMTKVEKFNFLEKLMDMIPLYVLVILMLVWVLLMMLIMMLDKIKYLRE
ncbi:E3 ubiquitin-protein ligase TRIM35-like [Clarias gariepinus]|uniref:E3 ubiquitin-protein ligase TRIM35-like n=1 Tax=Clarias gariepinus TaxID=13013 RepID=UPI00234C39A9|nr:E3 ubiquitin-protein ligase TRIM35-like [Clarias gariepinus]